MVNPFQAPSDRPAPPRVPRADPPRADLRVKQGATEWRLRFWDDELRFDGDGQELALSREAFLEAVVVTSGSRALVLRTPKPLLLSLDAEGERAYRAWLAPMRAAFVERAVRQRFRWAYPVAGVVLLVGVGGLAARPGGPTPGLGDVGFLLFGLVYLCCGFLARRRPVAALFLLDALGWVLLGASNVYFGLEGGRLGGIFAAFALLIAYRSVGRWRFLRGLAAAPTT